MKETGRRSSTLLSVKFLGFFFYHWEELLQIDEGQRRTVGKAIGNHR